MGFAQSKGRIVINTGAGRCDKVNPERLTLYGFIGDRRVQSVDVNGGTITVNRFEEIRRKLCNSLMLI